MCGASNFLAEHHKNISHFARRKRCDMSQQKGCMKSDILWKNNQRVFFQKAIQEIIVRYDYSISMHFAC